MAMRRRLHRAQIFRNFAYDLTWEFLLDECSVLQEFLCLRRAKGLRKQEQTKNRKRKLSFQTMSVLCSNGFSLKLQESSG